MNDHFGPSGDDEWAAAATPPPPPPPPQTPIEPVLTLDTEAEVTSSSGFGGRALAGIVGGLLLVGGTAFAVTQLGSSGPETAEDAVADLIDAAGDEDLVGLLAALDPGERDTLRGPVEDIFGELERLEVLDDSFDLGSVAGIDFEFADVTYRTEPVRDGLTRVYLTGGTVTSSIDTDELPIGDFVKDTVDRFGGEISGFQESDTTSIHQDGNDEVFLVAREGDDGWRVSIGYTIAELARLDAGQPLLAAGIQPVGADSPEAAVEGMVDALVQLDMRDAIARLSPNEFAALHDYADLFLADAEAEIDEFRDEFDVTVDELSLRSDVSGDTASVFVDSVAVTVRADGEQFSASFADDCFTIEGDMESLDLEGSPFEDGPVCSEDLEDFSNEMFDDFGYDLGDEGGSNGERIEFPQIDTPEIGITTQRVDGEWFVAPIATGLDAMVSGLEVLERSHLDAMVDLVEGFVDGFSTSFEESLEFEEGFDEGFGFEEGVEIIEPPIEIDEYPVEQSIPGTQPGTPSTQKGAFDEAALNEFLLSFTGDEVAAACIRAELRGIDEAILAEIANSFSFDYEPSLEAQEIFFDAANLCF